MVAQVPGETAVMKRSANGFGAAAVARWNMSHSRSASERSSYRTSPTACGASLMRAAARPEHADEGGRQGPGAGEEEGAGGGQREREGRGRGGGRGGAGAAGRRAGGGTGKGHRRRDGGGGGRKEEPRADGHRWAAGRV